MLKEKCETWLVQLREKLKSMEREGANALEKLTGSVAAIRDTLGLMRKEILENPFSGPEEEILFFKYYKPRCYALMILQFEEFDLGQYKPAGPDDILRQYYLQELEFVRRFFARNAFLYGYYRNDMTELDHVYFIRGKDLNSGLLPAVPDADPLFSTGADYLFSKFIAYEWLQDKLLEAVRDLEAVQRAPGGSRKVRSLRWTGESINLVELGYGLFDSGQLNEGKAGIGEIFSWLEEKLQVSIGIPARRFVEISRRKRLSRTRFLDQMRDAINRKVDEGDAFVPGKGKF